MILRKEYYSKGFSIWKEGKQLQAMIEAGFSWASKIQCSIRWGRLRKIRSPPKPIYEKYPCPHLLPQSSSEPRPCHPSSRASGHPYSKDYRYHTNGGSLDQFERLSVHSNDENSPNRVRTLFLSSAQSNLKNSAQPTHSSSSDWLAFLDKWNAFFPLSGSAAHTLLASILWEPLRTCSAVRFFFCFGS